MNQHAKFSAGFGAGVTPPAADLVGGARRAGRDFAQEDLGARAIWAGIQNELRKELGDGAYDHYAAGLSFVAEVDGDILVAAATEFDRDRVRDNHLHRIQAVWDRMDRKRRHIRIEARDRIPADHLALAKADIAVNEAPAASEAPAAAEPRDLGVQSLDAFLVGDSNRVAYGLARRIALGASVAAQIVSIVGPHGVGKTMLLRGIEHGLTSTHGADYACYMSAEDFMLAFVDGVKRRDTSELRNRVRSARVVLLDDFQFILSKPATLEEFFAYARAVRAAGGVVVLTCDRPPSTIEQLDVRMRDELQGGVVARMELPERALRMQIVRAAADSIAADDPEFQFQDEWVEMVADRMPASGRALDGAVRNIYVATVLAEKPLVRASVEASIQLQLGAATMRRPKIDTIKDVTARTYGVTKADLESSCRKRVFARPRQYAMYLCRKMTDCSYPQIGRMFGERDHTTVLFAYRKIAAMAQKDAAVAEELVQVEQRILADPRTR